MKKTIHPSQLLIKGKHVARDCAEHIVIVTEFKDGLVCYYRQGGGFVLKRKVMDFKAEFRLMTDEEEAAANAYHPAIAYFDNGEHQAPGNTHQAWPCITNSSRWNGWAVPWFTRTTIELLFRRQYLAEHNAMDVNGAAVTPVFWFHEGEDYDKGIFFDNNIPDWVQLDHMVHNRTDYYCMDGYCWDLLEPTDRGNYLYTQMFPFVNDTASNQTDEELGQEFAKWSVQEGLHAFIECIERARVLEQSAAISWPQRQYILNWLHRWENCDDA